MKEEKRLKIKLKEEENEIIHLKSKLKSETNNVIFEKLIICKENSLLHLPNKKYIDNISHPILNINTVVEILSLYMDMEKDKKDWKKAIETALPKRKIENSHDGP